jgi:hypothetical protein
VTPAISDTEGPCAAVQPDVQCNPINNLRRTLGIGSAYAGDGEGPEGGYVYPGYSQFPSARLAGNGARSHAPRMFVVTEAEAAAIRATFGSAASWRQRSSCADCSLAFTDTMQARECARTIACDAAPVTRRHAGKSR